MKRVTPQAPLFYGQVKERLASIPGVRSAAVADGAAYSQFRVVGRPPRKQQPQAIVQEVGPDYFQTLARNIFPDDDPLGKLLHLRFGVNTGVGRDDEQPRLIVGVVADVKHWVPAQPAMPAIYTSDRQHQWEYPSGGSAIHLRKTLYVRTSREPSSIAASVRQAVSEVDRDQTSGESAQPGLDQHLQPPARPRTR